MSLRDRDLISIQEARELVSRAVTAQKRFAKFSQDQVDSVVEACAKAALDNVETLACSAVEETGFGNVPDKIIKNTLAAVNVPRAIRDMRTVGILGEDREKGIVEVASPVGVVAAVIPSTNPTSTAIYKMLISIKAGNAIVLSPHPSAIKCICQSATLLERAALAAGAPEGLVNCMQHTTLEGTRELMRQPAVGVILATGGTGLVRAAYGSGKPAYGVGPGNVPAFIERTADVRKAVGDIFAGTTFDYGTICSSEQAIVVEESVRERAIEECRQQGGYFLLPEEIEKISRMVILPGTHTPNTQIVGRPATIIAEMAGIKVPSNTRVLIARLEPTQVGREFPLSAEKLSPILAFYAVANLAEGIALCRRLLEFGGLGHTCSIHSQNRAVILEFGEATPAFRVVVNSSSVHGSIGYSTNLFPAMTLGCGAPGGNITSDNIGPQHLMNVKRIAWESRPVEHRTIPADPRVAGAGNVPGHEPQQKEMNLNPARAGVTTHAGESTASGGAMRETLVLPDRATIAKVVESVLSAKGIPRGSGASAGASKALPTPASVAADVATRLFGARAKLKEQTAGINTQVNILPAIPPSKPESQPAPTNPVSPFVSENDVRRAMTRSEKIFIGPKTILTPSARDLGLEHQVFIETEANSIR